MKVALNKIIERTMNKSGTKTRKTITVNSKTKLAEVNKKRTVKKDCRTEWGQEHYNSH
jgi:hypothetical protein